MCLNCDFINSVFISAQKNPVPNYMPVLSLLDQIEKQGRISLFAGDCLLNETHEHLMNELHYTVCHYFQCNTCKKYIFIGACIRGTPIYELRDDLENENIDKRIWGKVGTYFMTKH